MTELIRLLIAHFLADFFLQTEKIISQRRAKKWKSGLLYIHSLIYACVLFLAMGRWSMAYWIIPLIFATHVLIDGVKVYAKDDGKSFIIDQVSHFIVIIFIWIGFSSERLAIVFTLFRQTWDSEKILKITLGFLLILWPLGYLIGHITEPFRRKLDQEESRGLEKAGLWIGCLERLFVFSFVLLNNWEAIGLVAAAKSAFRFSEIKDTKRRKETEYILIGSLLSFGTAIAVALVIKIL